MSDGWVPDYTYIGKDGKAVLARDLEDQRDELVEALENLVDPFIGAISSERVHAACNLLAKIKGQPNE